MEGKSGVSRSIIDEVHSLYVEGNQMEGDSGVTPNIIDKLYS